MDIIPTAKFQESLCKIIVSIHCSYLKNQIINNAKEMFSKLMSIKLFISDIDTPLENEALNSLKSFDRVLILKPKQSRYKEAINLLEIRYSPGTIYIISNKGRRIETFLMVLISKNIEIEETLVTSFHHFVNKSLIRFDELLDNAVDFKLKCLEINYTLCKSVQFTENNQTIKIMQLLSEISDDDPPMIYYHVMLLMIRMLDADSGAFGIYCSTSKELKFYVKGDKLEENPISSLIDSRHSIYNAITLNNTITLKKAEIDTKLRNFINHLLPKYVKPINSLLISAQIIAMTKGLKCVAIFINSNNNEFTKQNEDYVINTLSYASPIIHMSNVLQIERLERSRTQRLLLVAKNIFSHLDNFDDLINNIMSEAKNLTGAESCSLFLMDEERNQLVSKVLNGVHKSKYKENRFPTSYGITGLVARTGQMLNIKNAKEHPYFSKTIDEISGKEAKSLLCFPIQNESGKVVGVAQLCNKLDMPYFSKFDEEISMGFSLFCHISIVNSLVYKKIEDTHQRNVLANKVMTSNNRAKEKIPIALVEKMAQSKIVKVEEILKDASKLTAIPRNVHESDTLMLCMSMFEELGYINRWHINRKTLAIFLLSVKRGYRDIPYHNWYHALTVGHFIYAAHLTFHIRRYLHEIEHYVLFIAAFCHDIDHRGTNNSFQTKSKSVLASLYSSESSMLEQHHFAQTVCILQTPDSNIFENMSQEEYLKALDLLRYIILATDLVHHFKKMPEIDKLPQRKYNINSLKDRTLMLCISITSADLSDQTKTWVAAKESAKAITNEFLRQGDMEKEMGNEPLTYMNREKAIIPQLQIQFLEGVVLPLFKIILKLFSEAQESVENITINIVKWRKLNNLVEEGKITGLDDTIFDQIDKGNILEQNETP